MVHRHYAEWMRPPVVFRGMLGIIVGVVLFGCATQPVLIQRASDPTPDRVRALLDQGANLETVNEEGDSALHEASESGRVETVRLLLDRGANIRAANRDGDTPLHKASTGGSVEVVRLLLDHGAEILASNVHGCTPLHTAAFSYTKGRGDIEQVIELLLERGAKPRLKNMHGQTPQAIAEVNGYEGEAMGK